MEIITPSEQAADTSKSFTFEKVWEALLKGDEQFKQIREENRKSQENMEKMLADLTMNIGGLNNTLGQFTEGMFSPELWEKFNDLGFDVTSQCCNKQFRKDKKLIAEVDVLMENGDYAIPVEIKTKLTLEDIDKHIERILKIRQYMDERGDNRKLVGAVAGSILSEKVVTYAQENGLFVIVPNGDSVSIAEAPPDFKVHEW